MYIIDYKQKTIAKFNKKDKGFITNDVALKICHDVFETNKRRVA